MASPLFNLIALVESLVSGFSVASFLFQVHLLVQGALVVVF